MPVEIITEEQWSEFSHDQRMGMIRGEGGSEIALQSLMYLVADLMAVGRIACMLAQQAEAALARIDVSRSRRDMGNIRAMRDVRDAIRAGLSREDDGDAEVSEEVGGGEESGDDDGPGMAAAADAFCQSQGAGVEEPVIVARSLCDLGDQAGGGEATNQETEVEGRDGGAQDWQA